MKDTSSSESLSRSPIDPTQETETGQVFLLVSFVVCCALSILLWALSGRWTSVGKWISILISELSAVVAGIFLVRVLVGDQARETQEGTQAVTKSPVRSERRPFALSEQFFIMRAEPLDNRLRDTQAAIAKKRRFATAVPSSTTEGQVGGEQGLDDTPQGPAFDDKLLQPEYAIGQGLISQSELNDLRNAYLAQSELSLGLIPSMLLIVFAMAFSLDAGGGQWWMSPIIILATVLLLLLALERRQKYRVELGLLLTSRWDKQLAADKAAQANRKSSVSKTEEDTIRKVLKEELKGLHLEVKPLVVEVHKSPEESQTKKDKPQPKAGDVF